MTEKIIKLDTQMDRGKKERVLVVGERKRIVYQRLSPILSKEFNVRELYILQDHKNPLFFIIRWLSLIRDWKKILREFKPDKVIICGDALISVWIIIFLIKLFRLEIEIILFRYDIENLRPYFEVFKYNVSHFITRQLERYCFLRADKIIHKGLKNELEFLPFYQKIKNKPHYLFREFLNKNLVKEYNPNIKLSRNDKEIHLVHVGGLYLKNATKGECFLNFAPKITKQKIHLHVYSEQPIEVIKKFKQIEKEDKYFHYEGLRKHEDLIKKLGRYDYLISTQPYFNYPKTWQKTVFGNKFYDGITSYLPIIVPKNLLATKKFVEENGIGFGYDFSKINKMKKTLENVKIKKYLNNIKRFIKSYDDDFINFNRFIKKNL